MKQIITFQVSGWWALEKPDTKKQKERGEVQLLLLLPLLKPLLLFLILLLAGTPHHDPEHRERPAADQPGAQVEED